MIPVQWRPAAAALSLLWMATGIGAFMVFMTQTLLARRMGAADYGMFASSLATVSMVAPVAAFGLSQFRLKAYGAEGWGADRWLRPSLRFTALTTPLAVGSVVLWALFGPPVDTLTRAMLLALAPVIVGFMAMDLVSSKLRLEDRFAALAAWQLLTPTARLCVALLAWSVPSVSVGAVALGYCLVAVAVTLLAVPHLLAMLRGRMALQGHGPRTSHASQEPPAVLQLGAQAWPYGMAAVLYPVFFQISTVMLKYLAGDEEAGRYGVALAIMTAIYLFPATIYQKFLLAKLHRWAAHDRDKFWRVHGQGNLAMLVSGIAMGAILALLSPHVDTLFGPQYQPVSKLLLLLAICVPIRFLSTSVGSALLTEGHMRYRVKAMAMAALAAIALNAALIPAYGETGAAIATILAEGLLLYTMYYGVKRMPR